MRRSFFGLRTGPGALQLFAGRVLDDRALEEIGIHPGVQFDCVRKRELAEIVLIEELTRV